MADQFVVHVGLAKTGTTFLQEVLAANRPGLRAVGWLYPFVAAEAHFHAALELRDDHERFGFSADAVAGTWAKLLGAAADFDAGALLSHELLAGLTVPQIERLRDDVIERVGVKPRVVLTVRDPARQVMAHWQESIKNGSQLTFAEFEHDSLDGDGPDLTLWRREQDLLDVLGRYGAVFGADDLQIVVVPPRAAPALSLWERFAEAVGIEAVEVSFPPATINRSLAISQLHLLRAVNRELGERLPRREFLVTSKRYFAQHVLAATPGERLTCPQRLEEWARTTSRQWQQAVSLGGYRCFGDLSDLEPVEFSSVDPDVVQTRVNPHMAAVLAALLVERSRAKNQA